jgi:hypothetical protein
MKVSASKLNGSFRELISIHCTSFGPKADDSDGSNSIGWPIHPFRPAADGCVRPLSGDKAIDFLKSIVGGLEKKSGRL